MKKRCRLFLCTLLVLVFPLIVGFQCSGINDDDDDNNVFYTIVLQDLASEHLQLTVIQNGFPFMEDRYTEKESSETPIGYDPWIESKYMPGEDSTLVVFASNFSEFIQDPGFEISGYIKFQGNEIGEYICSEAKVKMDLWGTFGLSSMETSKITITHYGEVGERIEGTFEVEINNSYNATGSFSVGREEDDDNNPLARILL